LVTPLSVVNLELIQISGTIHVINQGHWLVG
jgi:hypothetical protein